MKKSCTKERKISINLCYEQLIFNCVFGVCCTLEWAGPFQYPLASHRWPYESQNFPLKPLQSLKHWLAWRHIGCLESPREPIPSDGYTSWWKHSWRGWIKNTDYRNITKINLKYMGEKMLVWNFDYLCIWKKETIVVLKPVLKFAQFLFLWEYLGALSSSSFFFKFSFIKRKPGDLRS